MARHVEREGLPDMAEAIREIARENEVELIKLKAQIEALGN
jgi:hypothetical protein